MLFWRKGTFSMYLLYKENASAERLSEYGGYKVFGKI